MSAQAPAAPGTPGAPAAPGAASGFLPPSVALCTVGLAMASFMQVLDTTIANVSLPTIAGNLGASSQQATWVITSFAVSTAIALPLTGWLSRRFGERKLFIWATLAFVITSLLCGPGHDRVTCRASWPVRCTRSPSRCWCRSTHARSEGRRWRCWR